ncbi:hypothetical protein LMG10661_03067 [Ralstonia syzygii subsp. syzygii]|nr:hypothetical protein LMG10661_03067 [Ralstonia syzygii subsp. syzygii]
MTTDATVTRPLADTYVAAPAAGPFAWYREISGQERRTFWSCKVGYALDAMDTQILSFVIPTLIGVWACPRPMRG